MNDICAEGVRARSLGSAERELPLPEAFFSLVILATPQPSLRQNKILQAYTIALCPSPDLRLQRTGSEGKNPNPMMS